MVAIAQTKGNDIRFDVVVDAGIEINEKQPNGVTWNLMRAMVGSSENFV